MIRIAILDDYQNVSLEMADWSPLAGRAEITVFNDHLSEFDDVVGICTIDGSHNCDPCKANPYAICHASRN